MPRTERVFIVSALLFVGLGLTLAISRGLLGTEQAALLILLMAISLSVVAAAGTRWLRRGVDIPPEHTLPDTRFPLIPLPLDTLLPVLLVAGYVIFVQLFDSGALQALIVVIAGLSFAALFWANVHGLDTRDRYFGLAQTSLNVASHITAFLLFSVVYGLKTRSLYSSSAVTVVSALLIYELLSRDAAWHRALGMPVEGRRSTLVLLAVTTGLICGEITWGLNYWAALTTLVGGAFLLVVFYVIYGLVSHYVDHKLTRDVYLEFAAVGALAVLVVFASAFISTS